MISCVFYFFRYFLAIRESLYYDNNVSSHTDD